MAAPPARIALACITISAAARRYRLPACPHRRPWSHKPADGVTLADRKRPRQLRPAPAALRPSPRISPRSSVLTEPLPLHLALSAFTVTLKMQTAETILLTNPTNRDVCFKVKTTAPRRYCVRPNAARIPPNQTVKVEVVVQAMDAYPPEDKCKDKFLVQMAWLPDPTIGTTPCASFPAQPFLEGVELSRGANSHLAFWLGAEAARATSRERARPATHPSSDLLFFLLFSLAALCSRSHRRYRPLEEPGRQVNADLQTLRREEAKGRPRDPRPRAGRALSEPRLTRRCDTPRAVF